jgi:1,4-alpha-glucan branching enzyme
MSTPTVTSETAIATLLAGARHPDPFAVLGRHQQDGACVIRAYLPQAQTVRVGEHGPHMERVPDTDLFTWAGATDAVGDAHYRLHWIDKSGADAAVLDPYSFGSAIGEFDRQVFA